MKAIKSVLANRKLFQGGGLVPPGNPGPANGILASSESLIDAVVRDTVNPQGGPTLSMNQGGIAKFQFGGLGAAGNAFPSMTQLVDQGPPTELVPRLSEIRSGSEKSAVQDVARLQEARRAFDNREITREQLIQVQNEVLAKYGSVANLERLLPREAEAPVALTSPTSALPPEPLLSVEEVPPPPPPTASPEPAPQVISEQILEEKIPIAAGQRIQTAEAPTALTTEPVVTEPTVEEPQPTTIAEQLLVEKGEAPRDLDRPLDFWQDAREYQLRHRYGATNEQIDEILTVFPDLTQQEIFAGEFSWSEQLPGSLLGVETPLKRRTEEEYEASISQPWETEEITTVEEGPPSIPGGVHPDTLLDKIRPELAAGMDELQQRRAADIRGEPKEPIVDAIHDPGTLRSYLAGGGDPENAPSDATNRTVDSIIKDAISGIEDKPFDKEKFKQEIEALLPQVADDPETEGWLIMLMGASIMAGKDPNAWVNIGAGLEKSLPALINFKGKQKEKQRDREMTVAKLTIESSLSRGREDRAAIRGLETLGLQAEITDIQAAQELFKYRVQNNHLTPATLIGGKEGDPALYTPAGTLLDLDRAGLERATDAGLILLPWKNGGWKLSDLTEEGDTTYDKIKAANEGGTRQPYPMFAGIVRDPININYTTPSRGALDVGGPVNNMIGINELQAAYSEYDRVRKPTLNLMDDITYIQKLVMEDPGSFSGPGLIIEQLKDALVAVRGLPGAEAAMDFVSGLRAGGDKQNISFNDLSKVQQAQTRSLLILAKIAPILLDESGKTISDNDRKMVAMALGLDPVWDQESRTYKISITGQIFKNPNQIILAMNQTLKGLNNRLTDVDDSMRTALTKFGIPEIMNDLQRKQYQELEAKRDALAAEKTWEFGKGFFDIKKAELYDWSTGEQV